MSVVGGRMSVVGGRMSVVGGRMSCGAYDVSAWSLTFTLMIQVRPQCNAELRSCVKVEVAVLGSPSLKVLMVSVDAK